MLYTDPLRQNFVKEKTPARRRCFLRPTLFFQRSQKLLFGQPWGKPAEFGQDGVFLFLGLAFCVLDSEVLNLSFTNTAAADFFKTDDLSHKGILSSRILAKNRNKENAAAA